MSEKNRKSDLLEGSRAPAFRRVKRVAPEESPETPTAKAPDPDLGHSIIRKERYISPDFLRLEWERMWTRVWLLGAFEPDLPEPGDFVCTEIGRESVLLVRQQDRSVRAFYNVCMHRGNRLRPPGLGSTATFKCQYHHWEYGLDGAFVRIPDIDTFPQGAPPCRGLAEIACDTWGGFVWFSLDPQPAPLREYLDPLPSHLDPYNFHKMALTRDLTIEWDCNWKTSVDAFNESERAFEALQTAGKIRNWGVSNFDAGEMEQTFAIAGGDACAANQVLYNLSRRGIEYDLAPWCSTHNVAIMAYSPIEQGRVLQHRDLQRIAQRREATPAQVALAWVLRRKGVVAIPKAGTQAHVRENRAALELRLSAQDLDELDRAFPPPTGPAPLEML